MTNPPTDERGVTDAMVIAALQAYISETGTVDSRDGDLLHIDHEGMRSAIEAALSHQGEVEGWRPIETAHEGVPCIVGWIDEGDECVEFDTLEEGVWQMHYGGWEHFMSAAPAGSRGPSERAPYTHWMPLPSVPTSNLTALISKAEKV